MSENGEGAFDSIERRDLLRTVLGSGLAGASGLGVLPSTAAAIPDDYVRYWPIDTDVGRCVASDGEEYPGTGPGAANWFFWNGCSSYKTYKAVPGEPLILEAKTNDAQLLYIDFAIKEPNGNGGWTTVETIDGPDGQQLDVSYTHVPQSDRVRIDAHQGFYLDVYGPPEGKIPQDVQQSIDEKDQLITQIQSVAGSQLPDGSPTVDQRAQELLERIETEYPDSDSATQQQFEEGLKRMIYTERISKHAARVPTEDTTEPEGSVPDDSLLNDPVRDESLLDLTARAWVGFHVAISTAAIGGLPGVSTLEDLGASVTSEVLMQSRNVKTTTVPERRLNESQREELRELEDDIANTTEEFVITNESTLKEIRENIEDDGLQSSDVPTPILDSFKNTISGYESLVSTHLYNHYLVTDDTGPIDEHPSIDKTLTKRVDQIETDIDNQALAQVDETKLETIVDRANRRITKTIHESESEIQKVTDIEGPGTLAELALMSTAVLAKRKGALLAAGISTSLAATLGAYLLGLVAGSFNSGVQKLGETQKIHANESKRILE